MKKCSHCGGGCGSGNSFCTECGWPVPAAADTPPPPSDGSFVALNAGRIAGLLALLGFVLPWAGCGGNVTGMDLANQPGQSYLWIIPIAMTVALVVLFAGVRTIVQMRIAAGAAFLAGAAATACALYFWWDYYQWWKEGYGRSLWQLTNVIRYGSWLSLGSVITVAASGWWQWVALSRPERKLRPSPDTLITRPEATERRAGEQVLR
jgi:hypothetical protein